MRAAQARLARLAEEDHAEELDHDVGGERGGKRDERGPEGQQHVDEGPGHFVREQKRLQQQPLGHEAVQRRQPGHGKRADQGQPRDPRHAMDQAAEAPEVALAGRMQHRAGAEEQQALHERVIEAVIQQRDQGERAEGVHADAEEHDREPEAGEDDADVLDRGVGEQPLHVGLGRGKHHAVQRAEEPEARAARGPTTTRACPSRSKVTRSTP